MSFRRLFSKKPITRPPGPLPPAPVAPSNTVPADTTTFLNTAKVFSSVNGNPLLVADSDSAAITTILTTSGKGYLEVGTNPGVIVIGNVSERVTLTGSPTAINNAMNGLRYVPYSASSGADTISMQSSDGSNVVLSSFVITISGVAPPPPAAGPAPINTIPGTQSIVSPASSRTFGSSTGNALTVSDADSTSLTTTVAVSNGIFQITSLSGGANVLNNNTGAVTLIGTPAQINTALDASIYTPTPGFTGTATLTISTTDGTSTATNVVNIVVSNSAPAPAPVSSAPYYPFGSRIDLINGNYPYGIKVNNRTNSAMDTDLRNRYSQWKAARVYNIPGIQGGKAVKFTDANYPNTTQALTVSEGMGYGMLLAVIFEDQPTFDGLLVTVRARPAYSIPAGNANANLYLMNWKLGPNGESNDTYGGGWNAMDGDEDIAQALLMAARQWGASGTNWNYNLEAQRTIAALKAWNFKTDGTSKGLAKPDISRTSDYMYGHFRSFAFAMNDAWWVDTVIVRSKAIIEKCQTVFSAANGGPACFPPDFVVNTGGELSGMPIGSNPNPEAPAWIQPGNVTNFAAAFGLTGPNYGTGTTNYTPSPGGRGDFVATEMHYYANAQRCPQRWGNDYIFSGDATLKIQSNRLTNYVKTAQSGLPGSTPIGYRLNAGLTGPQGGPISMGTSWPARGLVAGFGCGAQVDSAHQTWLNDCYSWMITNWTVAYYDCELMLMALVAMSGNWWTVPGNPQSTAIINNYPAGTSTNQDTARVFSAANSNQFSVTYTGNLPVTTTMACTNGTMTLTSGGGGTITGNNSASAQVSGTLSQVNQALTTVTYTPTTSFTGNSTITMTSSDGTVTDIDTVSVSVTATSPPPPPPPGGSTGEDVLTAYFANSSQQGVWLDSQPISRFNTEANSGVALTAYGSLFGRWKDRSGRVNDFIEPDLFSRPTAKDTPTAPHASIYHSNAIANAGGSSNAMYFCLVGRLRTYYGTYFSDSSSNSGIRLSHNSDESGQAVYENAPAPLGDIILSVGRGTARVEARRFSMGTGGANAGNPPPFTQYTGVVCIDGWFDGTNINLRVNKGTVDSVALGASAISAGNASLVLTAQDVANTDWMDQDIFQFVFLKNACPTQTERDLIATWCAARGGITI